MYKAKCSFFHFDHFNSCINLVEHCGGCMADYDDTEKQAELSLTWSMATDYQWKLLRPCSRQTTWGAYLMCSVNHRFAKMVEDIKNAYFVGRDRNPKTVNDAYYHICNGVNDIKHHHNGLYQPWSIICRSKNRCQCLIREKKIKRQFQCHVSQM